MGAIISIAVQRKMTRLKVTNHEASQAVKKLLLTKYRDIQLSSPSNLGCLNTVDLTTLEIHIGYLTVNLTAYMHLHYNLSITALISSVIREWSTVTSMQQGAPLDLPYSRPYS